MQSAPHPAARVTTDFVPSGPGGGTSGVENPTATGSYENGTLDTSGAGIGRPTTTTVPKIPGFEIEAELGRGGMGVVYRARQADLNRSVAIKMLLGGRYSDAVAQARFLIEAEVIARLRHPNVVQVYEFGRNDDQPYFVLEFVGGGSLAGRLKDVGRLTTRAAAELVACLADAMSAAHAQGIIHRDLKPANVLLTESGQPKVTDFGLAKMENSDVTASGAIMGTPSYMSPEQAAGQTRLVGTLSDVYALGAILYELLAGRPPFRGDSVMTTLKQVLEHEPIRPRVNDPSVPRDLETICLKCLEKDPHKRYATAELLGADLRAFVEGRPIAARPVGPGERLVKAMRRRPAVAALLALIVLAVLGGLAGVLYQYRETTRALGTASTNLDLYRAANTEAEAALEKESAALALQKQALTNETAARDAENIATLKQARNLYTAHMNLVQRAWERADLPYARELLERHIPEDEKAPDFRGFEWYYYWRLTHAATPKVTNLGNEVRGLSASPDGRSLVIASSGSASVWDTAGGAKPAPVGVQGFVSCAAYSPDGKWLAVAIGNGKEPGIVHLLEPQTLKISHTLKGHLYRIFALAFTPDSQTLISAATDLGNGNGTPWRRYYDIQSATPTKGELRFWNLAQPGEGTVADFGGNGGLSLAVSPNGRWLAVGRTDGRALLVDLPARKVETTLGRHQYPIWAIAVADDGRAATGGGQWDASELILWSYGLDADKVTLGIQYKALDGIGVRLTEVGVDSLAQKSGLRVDDLIIKVDSAHLTDGDADFQTEADKLRPGKQSILVVKRGTDKVVVPITPPAIKRDPKALEPAALVGHASSVQTAVFTKDGSRLLTAGLDRTLRVWDARTGRSRGAYRGHADGIWALALRADDREVYSLGSDGALFAWDLGTLQEYQEIQGGSPHGQTSIDASLADSTFVVPMSRYLFHIDADTGKVLHRLSESFDWKYGLGGKPMLWSTAFTEDGSNLFVMFHSPLEVLSDPSSAAALARADAEIIKTEPHYTLTVPQGQNKLLDLREVSTNAARCLLVADHRNLLEKIDDLQIWNLRTAKREPVAIKPRPRGLHFSSTGRYLHAYYWDDNSFHLWDLDAGQRMLMEKYPSPVSGATISPGEKYVAAATHDGLIRIWETNGLRLVHTLRTRAEATWGLRFSKDERTILASNWDGRIRLWDVETGEERLSLGGPSGAAHDVAITPDGRTVIGAYDGIAVIWRAAKNSEAPKFRRNQAVEKGVK